MVQTNTPTIQIVAPTIDVSGKVVYQPGPWGSKYPARKISATLTMTDPMGVSTFLSNSLGNDNGEFKIASPFIQSAFARITLEVTDDFTGEKDSLLLYPGLVGPNSGHQKIGEIVFPFKPEHPELAWINSIPFTDTKTLAKKLASLLGSPSYPLSIDLLSEWRGTVPRIPVEDPTAGDVLSRITGANGHTFKQPLPRKTPADVLAQNRANARILKASSQRFERPVPILTPAQKLLRMLSWSDFPKDLPDRIVKEIYGHGIMSGKPAGTVASIIAILERFSQVTIQDLENGSLLKRLGIGLQKAAKNTFHFESVTEEAAADMAAACVLIFLAGLAAKDKVHMKTAFNYWHNFPAANGITENRPYVKASIAITK